MAKSTSLRKEDVQPRCGYCEGSKVRPQMGTIYPFWICINCGDTVYSSISNEIGSSPNYKKKINFKIYIEEDERNVLEDIRFKYSTDANIIYAKYGLMESDQLVKHIKDVLDKGEAQWDSVSSAQRVE